MYKQPHTVKEQKELQAEKLLTEQELMAGIT